MIVERIWTGNAYRNYNYLIACPETGEALAIDPLDHGKCLAAAKAKGWQITQILNTHEHHDHTGGNAAVVAATGAKVIAHHRAGARIAGVDRGVKAGDVIKVGKTRRARSAWTRPATRCATSACARTPSSRRCSPATRCSTPAPATATTAAIRRTCTPPSSISSPSCPPTRSVYPGHDYIENNLRFTLAREPDNAAAKALLPEVHGQDPAKRARHDAAGRKADQHLPAPVEPERDRSAARGLSRSARRSPIRRPCSSSCASCAISGELLAGVQAAKELDSLSRPKRPPSYRTAASKIYSVESSSSGMK